MKHGILLLALVLALTLFAYACQSAQPVPSAPEGDGAATPEVSQTAAATQAPANAWSTISATEAYDMINSETPIVIVDVRTAEEYAEKHIPGAILIPNEEIDSTPPQALPVLDANILIYCRSGNRSAQAAKKLTDIGYTSVYDFGGINDWPYDTLSGAYEAPQKEGTLASFTSYDLDGVMLDEAVYSEYKLTMINIWATFCGPCINEMPELGQLAADYADKGVQIIGIVADVAQRSDGTFPRGMVDTARELVEQTGADYIHLLPTSDLVKAKLQTVSAVPETVFVDAQGNLVGKSFVGSRSGSEWAAIIDSLLEGMGA